MGYNEYPPDSALSDWVKCFWSIEDGPSDDIQEVWPDGCVELLFSLGNCFSVSADGACSYRFPKAAVIGLQTGVMHVRTEGEVRLLGARMLPFGVREWRPEDLHELGGRIEPLLRESRFQEAMRLLEAWLLRQPPVEDPLAAALRSLYDCAGDISVAELAAAQGQSARQLQRNFARRLGIAPKTLAKVVRFARSWAVLLDKPDISLSDLALELGYSDQAHFSNEFKSFGGQTPRTFSTEMSHSFKTGGE